MIRDSVPYNFWFAIWGVFLMCMLLCDETDGCVCGVLRFG